MRRSDFRKKINRNNNTIYNHHVSPADIFGMPVWVQNEGPATSKVQIVEIQSSDSDDSGKSNKGDRENSTDHKWCYAKNKEDDFKVNEAERRRKEKQNAASRSDTREYDDNLIFNELFGLTHHNKPDENDIYNQVNCFTIFDQYLMTSSDEELYGDIEVVNCRENIDECARNCRRYDGGDAVTYSPENENDKRTVLIYSFKNKHILSENDYELVNIPSQDSITSNINIQELFEPSTEKAERTRLPTPVPPQYVPRLVLPTSPVLPTLTEVSERGTLPPTEHTQDQMKSSIKKDIKENNWFLSEHVTPKNRLTHPDQRDESANIINWMALSPREKRRKLRNASPINFPPDQSSRLPTLKEVSSQAETFEETKLLKTSRSTNNVMQRDASMGCGDKLTRDQSTFIDNRFQSFGSTDRSRQSIFEHIGSCMLDSAKKSVRNIRSSLTSSRENNKEINTEAKVHEQEKKKEYVKGDHFSGRPRIRLSPKPVMRNITGPIENTESDNWIIEEKLIDDNRILMPRDGNGDCARDERWARSMELKPAEWNEYLALANVEDIPPLHLSMSSDSVEVEESLSWCRRFVLLFSCCQIICK